MSAPLFIHVQKDGGIWISNNQEFTPAGTSAGVFRVYPDAASQKITTVSGTSPNVAVTSATGKNGKEIT